MTAREIILRLVETKDIDKVIREKMDNYARAQDNSYLMKTITVIFYIFAMFMMIASIEGIRRLIGNHKKAKVSGRSAGSSRSFAIFFRSCHITVILTRFICMVLSKSWF